MIGQQALPFHLRKFARSEKGKAAIRPLGQLYSS